MGKFSQTGKRTALAQGKIHQSWGRDQISGERFTLSIENEATPSGRARYMKISLDKQEAINFAKYVARIAVVDPAKNSWFLETIESADALRQLADLIEKGEL